MARARASEAGIDVAGEALMLRGFFLDNMPQKALALVSALALVYFKHESGTTVISAHVRVQANHPPDRVLVTPMMDKVQIDVEGKYSALYKFDADNVPPLRLNLSGYEFEPIYISPEMFKVPPNIKIRRVRPGAVMVKFEKRRTETVTVSPRLEGEPANGFRVVRVSVEPAEVVIDGAESIVEEYRSVATKSVNITGLQSNLARHVGLVPPPQGLVYVDEGRSGARGYRVNVHVDEIRSERTFIGQSIEVRGAPETGPGYVVEPEAFTVTVEGPLRTIDGLSVTDVVPFVNLSDSDLEIEELKDVPVGVDLPAGVRPSAVLPAQARLIRLVGPLYDERAAAEVDSEQFEVAPPE